MYIYVYILGHAGFTSISRTMGAVILTLCVGFPSALISPTSDFIYTQLQSKKETTANVRNITATSISLTEHIIAAVSTMIITTK